VQVAEEIGLTPEARQWITYRCDHGHEVVHNVTWVDIDEATMRQHSEAAVSNKTAPAPMSYPAQKRNIGTPA